MKVLILGANGFIGASLLEKVLDLGHEVRVVTRKASEKFPKEVDVFVGDLTSEALDVESLVAGCEVIFNCAGELRNEDLMRPLHVDATRRLLNAVMVSLESRSSHCHWVQLSSVGAYGASRSERIVTEESESNPKGMYEITKTEADQLVMATGRGSSSGFSFSILRPSNVFGPKMPNSSLRQLAALIKKRLFFYVGYGRPVATYVHVQDVISALILCGFRREARGQIYNISNDCFMDELIDGLARSMQVARPVVKLPVMLVRSVFFVAGKFSKLPLTQERIDALTVRTRYPALKLEREMGFVFRYSVPDTIGDVLV